MTINQRIRVNQRIRELIRIALNINQVVSVYFLRLFGIVNFPVPPNSNMRRTSAKNVRHYIYSGISTYLPIATAAKFHGIKFDANTNILDFGCGVAGQLRPFIKHFPDATYHACDVDPSSIEFIRKSYPKIKAYANSFKPPLKFSDSQMDLIYSVSTFSHFDKETMDLWLLEFSRIIRDGGLLLLTIEGEYALSLVASETNEDPTEIKETLKKEGIFYKNYPWLNALQKRGPALTRSVDISSYFGESYGSTIMTRDHIYKNMNKYGFTVLGISEGVICERQDLVVLQRIEK